jgi:hypothetical protein
VRNWVKDVGLTFQIKNEGMHWIFTSGDFLIEVWPPTGRLVFNKDWKRACFVTNEDQLYSAIKKALPGEEKKGEYWSRVTTLVGAEVEWLD